MTEVRRHIECNREPRPRRRKCIDVANQCCALYIPIDERGQKTAQCALCEWNKLKISAKATAAIRFAGIFSSFVEFTVQMPQTFPFGTKIALWPI